MMLELRIPYATPSLNALTNRRSRFAYKTTRLRWERYVAEAWFEAKARHGRGPTLWLKPPRCRVRVTVERHGRQENALDHDNFLGGLKPLLDALRRFELIDNDRHAAIELVAHQPRTLTPPMMRTRILLERLEQDGHA